MSSDTRIRVSEENWKRINRAREPGETFDDTLQRLLDGDSDEPVEE
ncbi:hypothetical protein [Salinilacihabitans rarus]|nr:hypothetical protein [Salinilacihabitans rarus]